VIVTTIYLEILADLRFFGAAEFEKLYFGKLFVSL
jgi:hypothetical protein